MKSGKLSLLLPFLWSNFLSFNIFRIEPQNRFYTYFSHQTSFNCNFSSWPRWISQTGSNGFPLRDFSAPRSYLLCVCEWLLPVITSTTPHHMLPPLPLPRSSSDDGSEQSENTVSWNGDFSACSIHTSWVCEFSPFSPSSVMIVSKQAVQFLVQFIPCVTYCIPHGSFSPFSSSDDGF